MKNKNTPLGLVLVENYETMIRNIYGQSFFQGLRYVFCIYIKNIFLLSMFFMPLALLCGITSMIFHQFLMFYQPKLLKIMIFGLFTVLYLGYFLLFPWWIHCKISRTNGMLSLLYESSILEWKALFFNFASIAATCGTISSTFHIIGLLPSVILGVLCWGLMTYICFLAYRRLFSNSGIIEIPLIVKYKLRQELEIRVNRALDSSWLRFLLFVTFSTLKVFFAFFVSITVIVLTLISILIKNYFLRALIFVFITVLTFFIPFWIHRRYAGGIWMFLHKRSYLNIVSFFCLYAMFEDVVTMFCLYYETGRHIGIGLAILISYGAFKFYRKIFGITPRVK